MVALLGLECSSNSVSALGRPPTAFTLPLTRRDGVARTRGLLRNASLPLHGAVRDYGCLFILHHPLPSPPPPEPRAGSRRTGPSPLSALSVASRAHASPCCICISLRSGYVGISILTAACQSVEAELPRCIAKVLLRQHTARHAAEAVRSHSRHGVDDHLRPLHLLRRRLRHSPQGSALPHPPPQFFTHSRDSLRGLDPSAFLRRSVELGDRASGRCSCVYAET
jgi:hypothetical protein